MVEGTVAHRVLEELKRHNAPLDDDELAARLGISPRQTVNQVCRALEKVGRLHRYTGAAGKLVNDIRPPAHQAGLIVGDTARPVITETFEPPAGDSGVQRTAEHVMLGLLGEELGLVLKSKRFTLADGARVEVDGVDEDTSILVEAWAHQGQPKSAQKHKILADVLKLLHLASTLPSAPKLALCLCDPAAAHHFTTARSWAAHALRAFDVEVHVVELPADLRADILAAQKRQYR